VSGLRTFKNFHNQTTGCRDIAYCLVGHFILSHPVVSLCDTRRDRSRDGALKGGDKFKLWKLSQPTLFASPTIGKIKLCAQCTKI